MATANLSRDVQHGQLDYFRSPDSPEFRRTEQLVIRSRETGEIVAQSALWFNRIEADDIRDGDHFDAYWQLDFAPIDPKHLAAIVRHKKRKARRRKLLSTDPRCVYCGRGLDRETATVDHEVPTSKGGSDAPENLRLCCQSCNCCKGNRSLDQWLDDLQRAKEGGAA